jgi:pyrimidine-specific ribonucleoside hydrolase
MIGQKHYFLSIAMLIVIFTGCLPAQNKNAIENTITLPSEEEIIEEENVQPIITSSPAVAEPTDNPIKKIPVIFSHDGAADDIAALVYIAKHPNIDLIGVIQSYGEQHPSQSIDEWQVFLYDVLDYDSSAIAVGSDDPVDPNSNEFPAGWRDAADNFWGVPLPEKSEDYDSGIGADLLINLINDSPNKVTILITGAQTDMALALQKDPGIKDNISQIVIMGGAFNVAGNLYGTPELDSNKVAEWNIYVDPLAAKIVFNSGVPLSIVPLDGSNDLIITTESYNRIKDDDDPTLQILSRLWEQQFNIWGGDFIIWDIVAAVAVTNPEYFDWTYDDFDVDIKVGITQGQTIPLHDDSQVSRFASATDYNKVLEQIFEIYQ